MIAFLFAVATLLQDSAIERLLDKLRAEPIERRKEAREAIKKLGKDALPALRSGSKSLDLDYSAECKDLLREIEKDLAGEMAKSTFARLEHTMKVAKTLKIKIKERRELVIGAQNITTCTEGALLFKEGNRASLRISRKCLSDEDQNTEWVVILNRDQLIRQNTKRGTERLGAPADYVEAFLSFLLRAGLEEAFRVCDHALISGSKRELPFGITDLSAGPEGDSLKFIVQPPSFGIPENAGVLVRSTLRYDPKTARILGQSWHFEGPRNDVSIVRSTDYEECAFNLDVPDESFQISAVKK